MKKISANINESVIHELDLIAKHNGKTRSRCILEALLEYIVENQIDRTWKTEHFIVDFNRFNHLRKRLMDLENQGFIGVYWRGKDAKVHFR